MKLVLSRDQAVEVQPILGAQSGCKTGFIAVLNWHFDSSTGDRIAELEFVALRWADAIKVTKLAKKLAAGNEQQQARELFPTEESL